MAAASSASRIKRTRLRALFVANISMLALGLGGAITGAVAADTAFNIPAQPLADALVEFSQQSKTNIVASFRLVQGKRAPAVEGAMDIYAALARLLEGSGLKALQTRAGVITIQREEPRVVERAAAPAAPRAAQTPSSRALPLPMAEGISATIEEVVVTGSRIVRDGYEAPTPLTVIGGDELERAADSTLIGILNTMPAIVGSATAASSATSLAPGTAGLQTLNLRSLGANRVLILLDGQRPGGSSLAGLVDIASLPRPLVQRVEVVTGGASAVYGSDAVAGVVNFVLDRGFSGVKGEISGGITAYGDDETYKVETSGGFDFAGGRGHILLSGEHMYIAGIQSDGGRAWNRTGYQQMVNPAYTATNGQPQQIVQVNTGPATITPGGLIVSGPLKGIAFGAGGTPFPYTYGSVFSNPYMIGGDWRLGDLRPFSDLDPRQESSGLFTRVSYGIADNTTLYAQYGWSQSHIRNDIASPWLFGGGATSPVIQIDNAYLPASVRSAMADNGISSFQLGTTNGDMIPIGNDNLRVTSRFTAGVEGTFTGLDTLWDWNAYYAYGATKLGVHTPNAILRANYHQAIDAVVNPASGQIVCRITLTNPASGCRPWNVLGVGVNENNQAAFDWINNNGEAGYQHGLVEQTTYSVSISGEPVSLWAGPVSLAISAEHRKDRVRATTDAPGVAGAHLFGNFPSLAGAQSVTEGALETVIPLAGNAPWAQAWDLSVAARFTDYNLSGFVTTHKIGSTFAPVDDIKFRVTRSRDVRAPNLQELFAPGSITTASPQIIDRFVPGSPQYPLGTTLTRGNPRLLPEKADTTGIGVVLRPRFLDQLTASIDFWDVNVKGAIAQLTAQQLIDACFSGQFPSVCTDIVRNAGTGQIQQIQLSSINLVTQNVRGIDIEASYRTRLADIAPGLAGALSLHGLTTFYLRNYQNNPVAPPSNHVGENTAANPPHWKLTATATYTLDPVSISLMARAISRGKINSEYIECTSGCPPATVAHPTINYNRVAGRFYLDANATYKVSFGDVASGDIFVSAKNMFNSDPPLLVTQFFQNLAQPAVLYDSFGAVFRAGIRFRM